ncbi:hypothetical protein B0A48_05428 [Cryoendolithus antarcticus]|uniref:MYND-type domain-containing protein n=1 Tax=Cryoendolithus antarcticus TaxID=1507870 RepID=A0A1V8TIY1_9PEZI|nr:hypothetical protein B0A48_05428 [Cryoendolithus antarcticus]
MATPCTVCKGSAKHRCSRRSEGVDVDGHPTSTWYCGTECQKAHWSIHKTECKSVNLRKHLYRAGDILQATFLAHTRTTWNYRIVNIERGVDGRLQVHSEQKYTEHRVAFQGAHLSAIEQGALLSHHEGVTPTSEMGGAIKQALAGTVVNLEESMVIPKGASLLEWKARPGPEEYWVMRAKLADGSLWALDLACAKYGTTRPVTPWMTFVDERVTAIIATAPAGTTERMLDDSLDEIMAKHKQSGIVDKLSKDVLCTDSFRQIARYVLSLTTSHEDGHMTLTELAKLPNKDFEAAKEAYVVRYAHTFNTLLEGAEKKDGLSAAALKLRIGL